MDRFFERIAAQIGEVPGVAAVALGGSRARGQEDAESDSDFGIYYDTEAPPDLEHLSEVARKIDDRHPAEPLTPIGGWGPWINGGGWLVIDGRRVDWIFRDLDRVAAAISDACEGRITSHYQPGHPHAFHNFIYAGEVHHAAALFDPQRRLELLRRSTAPYPAALQRAIVNRFLWESDFALRTAETSVKRGDHYHATGSFFRSVACVIQVLFALNGRWFVNEKRSVEVVKSFERRPPAFGEFVESVFSGIAVPLPEKLVRLGSLAEQTRELAASI